LTEQNANVDQKGSVSLPTESAASTGDKRIDDITPPVTARLRLCLFIDEHLA